MKRESVVILHDIRSVHNVGAIFRTADAAGISKVYLTGYTPTPIDQFGRARSDLAKAALGAELTVAWEQAKTVTGVMTELKKQGFTIIAVEQAKNSVDYKKVKVPAKVAFLMGNEVEGIAPIILKKCDVIAEIPMKGKKESLNVSVSFGIALFRMLNI